jgi:hypothetical protein
MIAKTSQGRIGRQSLEFSQNPIWFQLILPASFQAQPRQGNVSIVYLSRSTPPWVSKPQARE